MIYLRESRMIKEYEYLSRSIGFEDGEMFSKVMGDWCRQAHPASLSFWEVRQAIAEAKALVGVTGLYTLHDTPSSVVRLGWFGICQAHQGTGVAQQLMTLTRDWSCGLGFATLLVHTESGNGRAIRFYQKCGFELLGTGRELPDWMSYEPDDVVLSLTLQAV